MKEYYPIAIVGGGLVGSSLACSLAQLGISCAVLEAFPIDSQEQPSFDDRTVALSASSLNIFRKLGLLDLINKQSQSIKNIHISEEGGFGFARILSKDVEVERLGSVIENWKLGKILKEQIAQSACIEYFSSAEVVSIDQGGKQSCLDIEYKGKKTSICAQLVIVADGARSGLREQLAIATSTVDYKKSAIVCNLSTQLEHENWAYERFTSEGPLALLPLSKKRMALVWSKKNEDAEKYTRMSEEEFSRDLEKVFGFRLGKIIKVGNRKSFPLIQSVAESIFIGRCLLIGNSAQSLHPIAGQGFNLGLRDIAALTDVINTFSSTSQVNSSIDYGSYPLLRSYQLKRQADREQTIKVTESLAHLFATKWIGISLTRNLLLKFLDLVTPVKKIFARSAMGFNFTNSSMSRNSSDEH